MTLTRPRILTIGLGLVVIALLSGGYPNKPYDPDEVHKSEKHDFRVEVIAEGFDNPWGMAFLPDGRLLVTEKPGRLRIVSPDGIVSDSVAGVPEVCNCRQGGLLDVQVHPEFEDNSLIYLSFADRLIPDSTFAFTRVVRGRLADNELVDVEDIFRVDDDFYTKRGQHFGSRIVLKDGYIFFSVGDRGARDTGPQFLDQPNGKIHRLHDDGRVPADNPFVDTPGAIASIWSYGHRNPQGLALHPETGDLWEAEHGPQGGDELNHIVPGNNYGWPVITYGENYNGTAITDITEKEGMEQPVLHWTPSIAVCGIEFYNGTAFPGWANNVFATSLKFSEVRRVELEGNEFAHQEVVYKPAGRVRDVQTGPDGFLYVAVESDAGQIIRLVPA